MFTAAGRHRRVVDDGEHRRLVFPFPHDHAPSMVVGDGVVGGDVDWLVETF